MTYLITQTFILLLLAGLIGLILGWYLTRLSTQGAQASLQTRLAGAEADARELRTELDTAVTTRGQAEAERKQMADELAECRERLSSADVTPAIEVTEEAAPEALSADADTAAPPLLDAARTEVDDLQRIKGIGPKIAGILAELGISRFEQIAAWTPENVAWVNGHLRFKRRVEREKWIPQAQALLDERD